MSGRSKPNSSINTCRNSLRNRRADRCLNRLHGQGSECVQSAPMEVRNRSCSCINAMFSKNPIGFPPSSLGGMADFPIVKPSGCKTPPKADVPLRCIPIINTGAGCKTRGCRRICNLINCPGDFNALRKLQFSCVRDHCGAGTATTSLSVISLPSDQHKSPSIRANDNTNCTNFHAARVVPKFEQVAQATRLFRSTTNRPERMRQSWTNPIWQ